MDVVKEKTGVSNEKTVYGRVEQRSEMKYEGLRHYCVPRTQQVVNVFPITIKIHKLELSNTRYCVLEFIIAVDT